MDPITISAGIQAVGALFKGVSGFLGGNAQAKAEKAAAAQAGAESGLAAQQALEQGDQVAAQGAVAAAANGGGFVGSSLAAISNLSRQAMFNARAAAYRGQTEIQNHLYQGKVDKANGLNALIGSLSPAAGALLGPAAQAEGQAKLAASLAPVSTPGTGPSLDALKGLY